MIDKEAVRAIAGIMVELALVAPEKRRHVLTLAWKMLLEHPDEIQKLASIIKGGNT